MAELDVRLYKMNTRLIDGLVAGILITRAFELLPQVFWPPSEIDSGWWGATIGAIVQLGCAFGLLFFRKIFVWITLILLCVMLSLIALMAFQIPMPSKASWLYFIDANLYVGSAAILIHSLTRKKTLSNTA